VLVSRAALRGTGDTGETFVCVAQDISARKEAERELQRSLEEKNVLLREVQHRVKNNLQVILSLLHVQAQAVRDPDARRRFEDSLRRVRSIAAIHEQLYASSDFARVEFGTYLDRLTKRLLDAHRSQAVSVQVDADDDATLPVTLAIPAGLIVNELVSNALEHAFPEDRAGTIAVQFRTDASTATLVVEDDGTGTNASIFASGASPERSSSGGRPPNSVSSDDSSLGVRLVRGLVRQLRGSMDVQTDPGVRVVVRFPIDTGDSRPSSLESVSD
jgi:two-component sensor histidine kinase